MYLEYIPITDPENAGKYIVYRPLMGLAFVGNQAMVNLIQTIVDDPTTPIAPNQEPAINFLRDIGFFYVEISSLYFDY